MLFRNVAAWPDVDFTEICPAGEHPVNFVAQEFHVKGHHCFIYPEPTLSIQDPPQVNRALTEREGFPIIAIAETKFASFWKSFKDRDTDGYWLAKKYVTIFLTSWNILHV